jgi:hypothetical protein
VILSVHLADVGPRTALRFLRRGLDAASVPGLRYAEPAITAPLGRRVPAPRLGRAGLIAAWDDDAALDEFLDGHELARPLADGWHVRLEPVRAYGAWSALPDFPAEEQPVGADEPVAVLTLGRLKLPRLIPFVRASSPAERQAIADPALIAATGLARPPRFVATFSLWRGAAAMRAYATGAAGRSHLEAMKAHRARPFHHESMFARFRPYAAQGEWDGREPLSLAHPAGAPAHSS